MKTNRKPSDSDQCIRESMEEINQRKTISATEKSNTMCGKWKDGVMSRGLMQKCGAEPKICVVHYVDVLEFIYMSVGVSCVFEEATQGRRCVGST